LKDGQLQLTNSRDPTSPEHNTVTQTTHDTAGQPVDSRRANRARFTFDKTFSEDATNINVYENVAKGIVESVTTGLNGTIFAYGQTSSGKTYTMHGSGSIQEGYSQGIVHMAADDIFLSVKNTPDRSFRICVSFFEIYNEKVRDLLNDNADLVVRVDEHGTASVIAAKKIVTDFESLSKVLVSGEKNRVVASTRMNKSSSRSHTIFRITIESHQKNEAASNLSLPSDDGAVLISTLDIVDLAGSESVRHTGSTGT
jgi:centromeric protein E